MPSQQALPDTSKLKALIREAGLRVTTGRVAVLRHLYEAQRPQQHADIAPAIEHLGLNNTTIYRNLNDLVEAGLIVRLDLGDHVWRYAPHGSHAASTHPHFICNGCNAVICLPEVNVELPAGAQSPKSVQQGAVDIQIRGQCDRCNTDEG